MKENIEEFAIIINNRGKLSILDLGYVDRWDWDDFNTMRDESNNIITFPSRAEAISHLVNTFDEELIEPNLVRESEFPTGVKFSDGIEDLFK